jgi:hypothetical protein
VSERALSRAVVRFANLLRRQSLPITIGEKDSKELTFTFKAQ